MTWDLIGHFNITFIYKETNNYKKEKMLNKI